MKTIFTIMLIINSICLPQDYWEPTAGPYGGPIYDITVNSAGHIFSGNFFNGIFRSTDNGLNWTPVNNGLTDNSFYSIAVNSYDHLFAGSYENGIFRSTDNGENWLQINNGFPATAGVEVILVNSSGHVFAGTSESGLFRSTNNGNNWHAINSGLSSSEILSLLFKPDGNIFTGTYDGVFRSTNNGETWTHSGIPSTGVYTLAANSNGDIFAGTYYGVYCSTNNGTSWSLKTNSPLKILSLLINDDYIFAGTNSNTVYLSTDNGENWIESGSGLPDPVTILSMAINPNDELFIATNCGVFCSSDQGLNWHEKNNGLLNTYILVMAANRENRIFASNWGVGLSRSDDNGENWIRVNTGLSAPYSMLITSENYIFAGTSRGIYRSTDNGESWELKSSGLQSLALALAQTSSGHLFAGTYPYGVYKSTNNGETWIGAGLNNHQVSGLVVSRTGAIIAAANGGVFRSTNGGSSWSYVPIFTQPNNLTCLAINSNGHIFGGSNVGVFLSVNHGYSWSRVSSGPINSAITSSLAFTYNNHIFAATNTGVFLSTDNGTSWTGVNDGLQITNIVSVMVDNNGFVYAGTGGNGVFRSKASTLPLPDKPYLALPEDGSVLSADTTLCIWKSASPLITGYRLQVAYDSLFTTTIFVDSIITDTSTIIRGLVPDQIYWWRVSACNGAGWSDYSSAWSFQVVLSGTGEHEKLPLQFELSQNYPNPFNPSTKIKYAVSKRQFVTMKVYDILGKEVATLVSGEKQPGYYSVNFDAGKLTAGVYIYKIQAGDFTDSKKMIVLK